MSWFAHIVSFVNTVIISSNVVYERANGTYHFRKFEE